jgi:hypothetical protein
MNEATCQPANQLAGQPVSLKHFQTTLQSLLLRETILQEQTCSTIRFSSPSSVVVGVPNRSEACRDFGASVGISAGWRAHRGELFIQLAGSFLNIEYEEMKQDAVGPNYRRSHGRGRFAASLAAHPGGHISPAGHPVFNDPKRNLSFRPQVFVVRSVQGVLSLRFSFGCLLDDLTIGVGSAHRRPNDGAIPPRDRLVEVKQRKTYPQAWYSARLEFQLLIF